MDFDDLAVSFLFRIETRLSMDYTLTECECLNEIVAANKMLAHQGGLEFQLVAPTPAVSNPCIQP